MSTGSFVSPARTQVCSGAATHPSLGDIFINSVARYVCTKRSMIESAFDDGAGTCRVGICCGYIAVAFSSAVGGGVGACVFSPDSDAAPAIKIGTGPTPSSTASKPCPDSGRGIRAPPINLLRRRWRRRICVARKFPRDKLSECVILASHRCKEGAVGPIFPIAHIDHCNLLRPNRIFKNRIGGLLARS